MSVCIPDKNRGVCGGIDLGGTKIEATLFGPDLQVISSHRRTTPPDDYNALLSTLLNEISLLRRRADNSDLPVGIGFPGLVDQKTGLSVTANLPADGHPLGSDLISSAGGIIAVANDCKCFALSEASGGAGSGFPTVFGLIIGTGLGGGICHNGHLMPGLNGLAGEIGHVALPAHLIKQYDLPLLPCGCGRTGCYETLVSGTGLTALCKAITGRSLTAKDISAQVLAGDSQMKQVLDIWSAITAELLHNIVMHLDPDCIVLGGGLSNISGIEQTLHDALSEIVLPAVRLPQILKPKFGDSSGGRGAAILAQQTKGNT